MKSIDNLLDRTWTTDYTCNEFTCEAWKQITGKDLKNRIEMFLNGKGQFKQINEPISPCLVFLKHSDQSPTHVGLFYCDKLLHLTPRGVHYVPLEVVVMHFKEMRFYT